jgi:penicillin-binding protein 1A
VTLSILSLLAVGIIYFLVVFVQESKKLPSLAEIGNFKPSEGTQVLYADGSVMAVFATENRRPIKLEEMGKNIKDATVAIEDSRFYEHGGVDIHGIARAVFKNVAGGEMKEGASTITQQLARNINELGLGREKKLRRKVAEAILAMRIEQTFSKDEILELYLNQIYYGNGAYGCEAAALAYFHKPAKKLTLGEAAMLAGIPQRPGLYSQNMDAAYKRRDSVLQRMVDTHKITDLERDDAKAKPLKISKPQVHGSRLYGAPFFVNYVMQQLVNRYGADAVYSGWKIYTTINPEIQKAAEQTLAYGVHHYGEEANQAALISIDPKSGFIRAMVGGLDFKKNQFNIVTQGLRQPGSCFKPIVYLSAFDTETADLDKTYRDDPYIDEDHTTDKWRPKNYSGKYSNAPMQVRTALRHSINTVAVKVALDTGLHTVIDYAKRLGITTKIEPYAPIALGAASVHPIELCSAYSVFANEGKRAIPLSITRVVDSKGELVEETSVKIDDPHLKPESILMINEALEDIVQHGTGTAAAEVPNAHGKTGTTSDSRDAWFAGFTPELTTVIWVGRENRDKAGKLNKKEPYLAMPGATGGHLCAPIWKDFMLKAVPIQQAALKAANQAPAPKPTENTMNLDEKKKKTDPKKPVDPNALLNGQPNPALQNGLQPAGTPGATVPGTTTPGATSPGPGRPVPLTGTSTPPPSTSAPTTSLAPTSSAPIASAPTTAVISRANQDLPRAPRHSDTSNRMTEPTGRLAAPPVRHADPGDEMVTVRICADSQRRANQWCDTVIERRMRRRDIPRLCRTHHAPPGEGNG